MPEKKTFKITRTRTETATQEGYYKETIEDMLENFPGIFMWTHDSERDRVMIEEIAGDKKD